MIIYVSIAFFFVAVIGRIGYLQLIGGIELQTKAMAQWMRDLPLSPKRGVIFDKNGIILADSATLYTVYVRPNAVKNMAEVTDFLSKTLNIDEQTLTEKLSRHVSEITVAKKVTRDTMVKIVDRDLAGVYISESNYRYYPYGNFLTQVLGYTDSDGYGQEGFEKYYDDYLYGVEGYVMTETDLVGAELKDSSTTYVPAVSGLNAHLTIDYYIQLFAEAAVNDAMETHLATSASVLVMNAKTGAVLAMANAPNFDLNNVPRNNIDELFDGSKNRLLNSVFEPGSTFKILTLASALEAGVADLKNSFYCPGFRIVDGQRIKCWKTQGHGSETLSDGVKNSCNCVFMDLALGLGAEKFYSYLSDFGMNEKTGIDAYGEARGIMIAEDNVKNVDLARIGFGHAVAVTPVQLLTAACSAVNGGKLMTPHICSYISDDAGNVCYRFEPKVKRQVVSAETSKTVAGLLERVVSEGSGKGAFVNGYRIGGKTGTAQKYGANGRIAQGCYVSSFIGFAPADDPEYAVLVIVDEPKAIGYYGSIVAAPYAGEIFANIFAHYKINPDPKLVDEDYYRSFSMPNLVGKTFSEAASIMRMNGLEYEVSGNGGRVISQLPAPGATVTKYNIALIETS
ncbi:MAG: penicillin-binding transpeptidase domain-containing protein [Christensenellales bacterium]